MRLFAGLLALAFAGPAIAARAPAPSGGGMEITRNGATPSRKGPESAFTGAARFDRNFSAKAPANFTGAWVTFEPGARTSWHTHPLGQMLVVESGCGWVQAEGGAVETIRPGDVIWTPPGVRHWHGATATTAMTHLTVTQSQDGKSGDFQEKVTDAQYKGGAC